MLKSIKIENFRGFKSFELQQIGRINLLVGENNSGKTSILEAIQLLCSRTDLDVQVFATTHSSDCWQSLADIAEQENVTDDGIMIHRIEKGKSKSIVFNEAQIVIAAERELEVR
jgi:predicted ATP-dependent endonuclease of OLD family